MLIYGERHRRMRDGISARRDMGKRPMPAAQSGDHDGVPTTPVIPGRGPATAAGAGCCAAPGPGRVWMTLHSRTQGTFGRAASRFTADTPSLRRPVPARRISGIPAGRSTAVTW